MDVCRVCTLLNADGLGVSPSAVRLDAREDRWVAWLSGGRMAWFPMNAGGLQRLQTERRVLNLLNTRCSFRVPRVLHVAEAGWDVRASVPGVCDPWALYHRLQHDRALARSIGRSLGAFVAEQHSRITIDDTKDWLPHTLRWPEPWDSILARMPHVVHDAGLLHEIEQVVWRCQQQEADQSSGGVLVHSDLGLHNIALNPATDSVAGVFDYDNAAWADRHYDFRYFIFDRQDEDLLEGALEVYEPALGITLDRRRIRLLNAACAIGFLAFRHGTEPEALSCGRTLAQDLGWVRSALAALN